MTLPFTTDEIRVPVLVSWSKDLIDDGISNSRVIPVAWRDAILDTGSNITMISNKLVSELHLVPSEASQTLTAGGSRDVQLFRVSLGLQPIFGLTDTVILAENILVAAFPDDIPDVEVLLGLDVLSRIRMTIDGPAGFVAVEVPSPAA